MWKGDAGSEFPRGEEMGSKIREPAKLPDDDFM